MTLEENNAEEEFYKRIGKEPCHSWDMEAPSTKNGRCPYCELLFSLNSGFENKFLCPGCNTELFECDAFIYTLISDSFSLTLSNILPMYGRQFSADARIIVGISSPIKFPKKFLAIKKIFISSYVENSNILAEPANIKEDSFQIISSSTDKNDLNKEIIVHYWVNYLGEDSNYPLWLEYLYLATQLFNKEDYKTTIILLTSVLDSYFDNILREHINLYDEIVKKLDIPDKKDLIKKVFNITNYRFSSEIYNLITLRNKIAHGYDGKITVIKEECERFILLIIKILYYHACSKYPSHPKESLLNKTKFSDMP